MALFFQTFLQGWDGRNQEGELRKESSGRRAQATASGKGGFRGLGGAGLKQGCAPRARMQEEGAAEFSLLISLRIEPE